jgi:hypothetical protein
VGPDVLGGDTVGRGEKIGRRRVVCGERGGIAVGGIAAGGIYAGGIYADVRADRAPFFAGGFDGLSFCK